MPPMFLANCLYLVMIMIVGNLVEDKSQFVFTIFSNFQVSDSDNEVDKVHRSHRPGCQTSTSLGQLQSRRLAPTDNQLGGQQRQQQQQQQQQNSIHILVLKVWNLHLVTRLHRFTLNPDASFLIWRRDTLVVAPLFTGVVQVPLGFMSSEKFCWSESKQIAPVYYVTKPPIKIHIIIIIQDLKTVYL